jgi:hypothetical protein
VDRDGDVDVVAALAGVDKVLVFTNKTRDSAAGGAILELTSEWSVGHEPLFVMLADLNGDGWMDFATTDTGGDTISTAFNRGRDQTGVGVDRAPTISPAVPPRLAGSCRPVGCSRRRIAGRQRDIHPNAPLLWVRRPLRS